MQKSYNNSVDIWSIGIIAHLLLVGYLPFDADKDDEIIKKTIFDDITFSNSRWDNISDVAKDFVLKCLEKNSENRPNIT